MTNFPSYLKASRNQIGVFLKLLIPSKTVGSIFRVLCVHFCIFVAKIFCSDSLRNNTPNRINRFDSPYPEVKLIVAATGPSVQFLLVKNHFF